MRQRVRSVIDHRWHQNVSEEVIAESVTNIQVFDILYKCTLRMNGSELENSQGIFVEAL